MKSINCYISTDQWHKLNAKYRPEVKSDIRDFNINLTRVRTWQSSNFIVTETFYYQKEADGSLVLRDGDYKFNGDAALLES